MKKKVIISMAVVALLVCLVTVLCLSGCVNASNAPEKTSEAWSKIDNKTATSVVTIKNAELSLGDGKLTAKASAEVKLTREFSGGNMTMKIEAGLTAFELGGSDPTIANMVNAAAGAFVNFDELKNLKITGTVFYNAAEEGKPIGIKDLKVKNLATAIPAIKGVNDDWDIKFSDGNGGYTSEVSYPIGNLNEQLTSGTAASIVNGLFPDGLDVLGMIDDLLLDQTMLDFSNKDNAAYKKGVYTNEVAATDNINFLLSLWNGLMSSNKAMVLGLLGDVEIKEATETEPAITIMDVLEDLGIANDPINDLINNCMNKGKMTVEGKIDSKIFTELKATISGVKLTLDADQVEAVVGLVTTLIPSIPSNVTEIINKVAGGEAYLSLGTITVNNTYTVA